MSELNVYLERNGRLIQTGTITGNNSTDAGYPKVKEMTERIIKSGGIRNVQGGRL